VVLLLGGWAWGCQPFTVKNKFVTKRKEPRTWTDSLDRRPKRRNMNMRFGLWNERSLYKVGSLMTDLVGVQEV
jgi:hypothetical protein